MICELGKNNECRLFIWMAMIKSKGNSIFYLGQPRVYFLKLWVLKPVVFFSLINGRVKFQVCFLVKQNQLRGSTKLKSSNALTFWNMIPFFHHWDAAWNLNHSYFHEGHPSNRLIIRVDDEYIPCCSTTQEDLRMGIEVNIVFVKVWILKEKASVNFVCFLDDTSHWWVPSMITPRAEVSLIDCPTDKGFVNDFLNSHLLGWEHIVERVAILFKPKLICSFDFCEMNTQSSDGIVFGRVNNYGRIIFSFNGPCSLCKLSDKPIIPTFKSIVRFSFITDVVIIVDKLRGLFAKPSSFLSVHVP